MGITNRPDDSHTLQHTRTPPDTLLPTHKIRDDIFRSLLLAGHPRGSLHHNSSHGSGDTDRTPFFPVRQSMAKGSPLKIVTELDIINDPLAATHFKSLTSRPHGSLIHEQASCETAVNPDLLGTGSATISILHTESSDKILYDLYETRTKSLQIQGQDSQPTWHLHRSDSSAEIEEDSIVLEPSSPEAKRWFQFAIAMHIAGGVAETDILDNIMFHLAIISDLPFGFPINNIISLSVSLDSGGTLANCRTPHANQGHLPGESTYRQRTGASRIPQNGGTLWRRTGTTRHPKSPHAEPRKLHPQHGPYEHSKTPHPSMENLGPQKAGLPLTLSLRVLQQRTHREKLSVATVTIRIHYSKMVTMLRADTPDIGDGHTATEAKLLRRFHELVTYCLGPRLPPDLLQSVLDSMDVEITLFKGVTNWTQSRIILLFNRQMKSGESTYTDLFPLEQVTP